MITDADQGAVLSWEADLPAYLCVGVGSEFSARLQYTSAGPRHRSGSIRVNPKAAGLAVNAQELPLGPKPAP